MSHIECGNGILTITEKCNKVRITKGKNSYIHTVGAANDLPLCFGDGTYFVEFLSHISGNVYRRLFTKTVRAKRTEAYMLKPNTYVPVTAAWDYEEEICQGKDKAKSYATVTNWIRKNIVYDYIKAVKTAKHVFRIPDPASCWQNKTGICQDIASLTVGMLRAVGIPSRVAVGKADRQTHAWVEAVIDGKTYRFDHPNHANDYRAEYWY